MSDLSINLDLFIVMITFSLWGSKGYFKLGLGTILLILIGLRLLLMFDIHMGKTLSMEDLKEQYPELYYKMYATDKEKLDYFGTKNEEKIIKLIKKVHKSDIQMFIDENPDIIVKIITALIWVFTGFCVIWMLRMMGLL